MVGDAAERGALIDAPWIGVIEDLCDLVGGPRGAEVVALDASIRLQGDVGAALQLARACAELERRRGLLLDVRREALHQPGPATFVVRIRRRAARGNGPAEGS